MAFDQSNDYLFQKCLFSGDRDSAPEKTFGKSPFKTTKGLGNADNRNTTSAPKKQLGKSPSKPAKSLSNEEWDVIFTSVLSVTDSPGNHK